MRRFLILISILPLLFLTSCDDDGGDGMQTAEKSVVGTWKCTALNASTETTTVYDSYWGFAPYHTTSTTVGEEIDYIWVFNEDGTFSTEGSYLAVLESTSTSDDLIEPLISNQDVPILGISAEGTYTFDDPILSLFTNVASANGEVLETEESEGEIVLDGNTMTLDQTADVSTESFGSVTTGTTEVNSTWVRE